jgi:hypothetical protein
MNTKSVPQKESVKKEEEVTNVMDQVGQVSNSQMLELLQQQQAGQRNAEESKKEQGR